MRREVIGTPAKGPDNVAAWIDFNHTVIELVRDKDISRPIETMRSAGVFSTNSHRRRGQNRERENCDGREFSEESAPCARFDREKCTGFLCRRMVHKRFDLQVSQRCRSRSWRQLTAVQCTRCLNHWLGSRDGVGGMSFASNVLFQGKGILLVVNAWVL